MLKNFDTMYLEAMDVAKKQDDEVKAKGSTKVISRLLDEKGGNVTINRLVFKRQPVVSQNLRNFSYVHGEGEIEFNIIIDVERNKFEITTNIVMKMKETPVKDEVFKSTYVSEIPKDDDELKSLLKSRSKKLTMDYKEETSDFGKRYFRSVMLYPLI